MSYKASYTMEFVDNVYLALFSDASPCQNATCGIGGTCVANGLYSYHCDCDPGWVGEFCESK